MERGKARSVLPERTGRKKCISSICSLSLSMIELQIYGETSQQDRKRSFLFQVYLFPLKECGGILRRVTDPEQLVT